MFEPQARHVDGLGRTAGSQARQVSHPGRLFDLFGEVFGIGADAREQARLERVHPVQAEEVQPWKWTDSALVEWTSPAIEHRETEPAVVVLVTGGPDDRRNPLAPEVERADLGHHQWQAWRCNVFLLRGVYAWVRARKLPGGRQEPSERSICFVEDVVRVLGSRQSTVRNPDHSTQHPDALCRHAAHVDVITAAHTGNHRGRRPLPPGEGVNRLREAAHSLKPPVDVLAPVTPWHAPVPRDGQEHRASCAQQLVADLAAGGAATDDEHRTVWQFLPS